MKKMTPVSPNGESFQVLSGDHLSHFTSPHFSTETDPISAAAQKASTLLPLAHQKQSSNYWKCTYPLRLVSPNSQSCFCSKKNITSAGGFFTNWAIREAPKKRNINYLLGAWTRGPKTKRRCSPASLTAGYGHCEVSQQTAEERSKREDLATETIKTQTYRSYGGPVLRDHLAVQGRATLIPGLWRCHRPQSN